MTKTPSASVFVPSDEISPPLHFALHPAAFHKKCRPIPVFCHGPRISPNANSLFSRLQPMNHRVRSATHFSFSSWNGKILSEKFITQLIDRIELILVLLARVLRVSANADKCRLVATGGHSILTHMMSLSRAKAGVTIASLNVRF